MDTIINIHRNLLPPKDREELIELGIYSFNYRFEFSAENIFYVKRDESIIFMFSYDYRDSICEIYDVCTDPEFRRQYIATKYLKHFIDSLNTQTRIWIGVIDKHLISFYVKIGFKPIEKTNITPLKREFSTFRFLSMEYDAMIASNSILQKNAEELGLQIIE